MNRKYKLSYFYTRIFKKHEVELTFDLFCDMSKTNLHEFTFQYGENYIIYTAIRKIDDEYIYELNIQNNDTINNYEFSSVEELTTAKVINNMSLYEIWDSLYN